VYWKEAVIKTERKVLTNPQTGELETVTTRTQLSPRRPMTPIEIEAARNGVMRALHSTTTYAQPQNKE
jgi:hypothetical protein